MQDNGGAVADFYSTAGAAGQPSYDANGDGKVWVRSQGTVKGVSRTVITQVKAQVQQISFPRNTLTAGYFAVTNNGKKTMVDTSGSSYSSTPSQPGALAVRCSSGPKSSCLNYDAGKGQVSPPSYQINHPPALQVGRPAQHHAWNSESEQHVLLEWLSFEHRRRNGVHRVRQLLLQRCLQLPERVRDGGSRKRNASFGGNGIYYGLVYLGNAQSSAGLLLTMNGCAKIIGSVMVEGQGGVQVGSCGNQIAFNPAVLGLAKGYGDPAPVKSTWREI